MSVSYTREIMILTWWVSGEKHIMNISFEIFTVVKWFIFWNLLTLEGQGSTKDQESLAQ
jgi:hypothetical protein